LKTERNGLQEGGVGCGDETGSLDGEEPEECKLAEPPGVGPKKACVSLWKPFSSGVGWEGVEPERGQVMGRSSSHRKGS